MLALDIVWLSANATASAKLIQTVQGSPVILRPLPTALVYLLLPAAVLYFTQAKTKTEAATKGAFLGAAMYGLYDLTNLSTLKGWTYQMAITDTLWGTTLCAVGAATAAAASK
jgi:uncharacterized membrane protein